ncbi:acyltransferase [Pseudogulbenkiania sp. MAI-1]|uniref:acyltransferase n=1 Tax=Pseudogulbenkiania sp. MAI-1 TaxID=990370 RepID=UPI0004B4CCF1|nr:acyltransferase [Pseudogulbenkiania sp. MAI-1]
MSQWSTAAERGSLLGMKALLWLFRLAGPAVVRWLLYPIVGYFFLTGRAARAASRDFLQRVRVANRDPRPVTAGEVYRHLYSFADAALDKMAAWAGRPGEVNVPGSAALQALAAEGRGALLVGAHLGNLEMCRALGHAAGVRKVNAVVYTRHAARFAGLLAAASGDYGVNLLHVPDMGVDTAILLKDKIDNGEWVVIVGDRTPASDNGRVQRAAFLGSPAPFAEGPWILASLLECPVYLLFCLKEDGRYRIELEPFAERIALPRKTRREALGAVIARYAVRLEHHARRVPLQWFNFYDFWRA